MFILGMSPLVVGCGGAGNDDMVDTPETDVAHSDAETDVVHTDDSDVVSNVEACETWCVALDDSCGDVDRPAFSDVAACRTYCERIGMRPGEDGDTAVNTLACRTHHATLAADDPDGHCAAAGPRGGGVCGSLVQNYCFLTSFICTGEDAIAWDVDCMTDAASYPETGEVTDTLGDSIHCRMFHARAALTGPDTHCPHASPEGGGICVEGQSERLGPAPRPGEPMCESVRKAHEALR